MPLEDRTLKICNCNKTMALDAKALADLPEPEPVASVSYKSGGELLIVGPAESAIAWAEKLAEQLEVNVLVTSQRGGELPAERRYPVWSGKVRSVKGYLGAFEVEW